MNRTEYLQKFQNGISIFEESYQQKQILDLDEKITKLVQSGKSEEDALKELGNVEKLIDEVYSQNHVNRQKAKEERNFLISHYNQLFRVIQHVIDVMSKNTAKANRKILLDVLLLILLTCVLKIPFIMVRDLGTNLLAFLAIPLLNNIWSLIIEILYLVFAITFFLNVFRKWFQNLKIGQE